MTTLRSQRTTASVNSLFAKIATVFVAVLLASAPAMAALLAPSGALFPVPVEAEPTGGITIAGGVPVPFAAGTFSGTLTTSVIAGDPSNTLGGLTFTYLLTNDAVSTSNIGRMTNLDYAGFLTDASNTGPGLAPTLVDRDAPGVVIGWSFIVAPPSLGVLGPGMSSTLMVVQTNAPAYVPQIANVIDGSVAMVPTFGPAVPEPAAMTLCITAGAICLARRRF